MVRMRSLARLSSQQDQRPRGRSHASGVWQWEACAGQAHDGLGSPGGRHRCGWCHRCHRTAPIRFLFCWCQLF